MRRRQDPAVAKKEDRIGWCRKLGRKRSDEIVRIDAELNVSGAENLSVRYDWVPVHCHQDDFGRSRVHDGEVKVFSLL